MLFQQVVINDNLQQVRYMTQMCMKQMCSLNAPTLVDTRLESLQNVHGKDVSFTKYCANIAQYLCTHIAW